MWSHICAVRRLRVTVPQLQRCRRVSSAFPHGFTSPSLDRIQRLRYNSIDREMTRYGKSTIRLQMTLQDLPVQLQQESRNEAPPIVWNVPTKNHNLKLIEPILFHTILSFNYLVNSNGLSEEYISRQRANQKQFLSSLSYLKSPYNNLQVSSICQNLFEEFDIPYVEDEIIESCVSLFLAIAKKSQYTMDDFTKWIKSVVSDNVNDACGHLRNLTNIPESVLVDVLLRTPISKQEFQLQLDMWLQFIKPITIAYIEKYSLIKACFNNLIFYSIHQLPSSLVLLITQSLNFFTDSRSGCQNSIITPDYLNEIIWDLAYNSVRGPPAQSINHIIKAQETLMKYFASDGLEDKKPYQQLTLKSYMAIAMAIDSISHEKAIQIFKIAETRFSKPSKKDLAAYNVVKTFLSSTPEALMSTFNSAAVNYSHVSMLWLVFIRKLGDFHLVNEARSIKIVNEMMKHKDDLIITKDIIAMLIHPIKGLNSFDRFLKKLDKDLVDRYSNILIPKYISMLYKNHSSTLTQSKYPWDQVFEQTSNGFKGFPSTIDYARHLYYTKVKKSPRNIGIMLQGEAICNPENVYNLYKEELKGLPPDSGCIYALMKASTKNDGSGNCILWGDLYAPQVAVHTFKMNVKMEEKDDSRINPDTRLWQQYIRLLSKFDYIEELALLIQWWEKIKFTPNHKTLLMLLQALPPEHSARYISHYEKVRQDSKKVGSHNQAPSDSHHWPWPTAEQVAENTRVPTKKKRSGAIGMCRV